MTAPTKVLMVEDQAFDAELLTDTMQQGGLVFQAERVDTSEMLEEALARFGPDIVLSDYTMPTFSGMHALNIVRRLRPETPFIFVSGTIGEERAIEALREGAVDYVLKDHPIRLVPAIRRALVEAEQRRERDRLRAELEESEAGLRQAQTIAKLGHVVTGPDGSFEDWSETLPQLIGVLPADMPKSTREWLDILHPDDRATFRSISIAAGASGTRVDVEYRLGRADGEWIDVRQAIEPIPGTAGADGRMRWFCTLQDVTEQKKVETKVRRLNRVYTVLSGINSLIVRVREREELFREACQIAVDAGAFRMAWIGVIDPQTLDGKVVATYGTDSHAPYIRLTALDGLPDSDRPASRAARSGAPVICNDIGTEPSVGPMREELLARGHKSFACLPLLLGGKAVAVLGLLSGDIGVFDDDETRLLLELAGDIAFVLDHIEKEEKLNYLAYYDSLTGLANSTLLHERLEQYISANGQEQQKLALVLIDLERFKTINDTFGRHMGDALLRQLAERLADCVPDRKQTGARRRGPFRGRDSRRAVGRRACADGGREVPAMLSRPISNRRH